MARRFTKPTRRQQLFVEAMNSGAASPTAAARTAGYPYAKQAAYRLMHHPKIRACLRPTTKERLANPRTAFKMALRVLKLHGIGPRMPRQERKVETITEYRGDARQELARLQREIARLTRHS
jgi:phage terminase small subunit